MGAKLGNPKWLHHDRTRHPQFRGRPPVTVCVATLFQWNYAPLGKPPQLGRGAIVASDRMITAWDTQYEPGQLKISFITSNTVILIAGDYSLHSEAIDDTHKQIHLNPDQTPHNIALIYGRAVQKIKQRQAEDRFLAPLGMNSDTFIAQQKEMSEGFIGRITDQLQEFRGEEVEALIVGSDGRNAHIWLVDTRGMSHCLNDVGFAAIGIGAWHAKSRLMQVGYTNMARLAPALAATFAAKKGAQIAPGVGTYTDVYIILKDAHFRLWENVDKKLHEIFEKYRAQTEQLTIDAITELQAYIDLGPEEQKAENERAQGTNGKNAQADGGSNPPAAEAARKDEVGHKDQKPGKAQEENS
jgi:hypothetical protein